MLLYFFDFSKSYSFLYFRRMKCFLKLDQRLKVSIFSYPHFQLSQIVMNFSSLPCFLYRHYKPQMSFEGCVFHQVLLLMNSLSAIVLRCPFFRPCTRPICLLHYLTRHLRLQKAKVYIIKNFELIHQVAQLRCCYVIGNLGFQFLYKFSSLFHRLDLHSQYED